jgi:hypothetical protein
LEAKAGFAVVVVSGQVGHKLRLVRYAVGTEADWVAQIAVLS